jgi:hypothetical protein
MRDARDARRCDKPHMLLTVSLVGWLGVTIIGVVILPIAYRWSLAETNAPSSYASRSESRVSGSILAAISGSFRRNKRRQAVPDPLNSIALPRHATPTGRSPHCRRRDHAFC